VPQAFLAIKFFVDTINSITLEEYLILWRNNYYTYWFPESGSGIWIWWMQSRAR